MNYILEWHNAENTVLAKIEGSHTVIVEPGNIDWEALSKEKDIIPFEQTELYKVLNPNEG